MKDYDINNNEQSDEIKNSDNTSSTAGNPAGYTYRGDGQNNTTPDMNTAPQNNGYAPDNAYSPYRSPAQGGTPNSAPYYTQNPQTGAPMNFYQQSGQISYAPQKPKEKRQKPGSRFSYGIVALICCISIVLCGCFGFAGTYIANRLTSGGRTSGTVTPSTPLVVYKDVSDVNDSTGTSGENLTYKQVAELVKDSVVEITTEYTTQSQWYQYVTEGAGSGVIISEDGYILTNTHVITNSSTGTVSDNIKVRLNNGTEYTASVIGYDSDSDISLIKIDATNLSPAVCGDSDTIAVGEEVIAVGNPLGELGGTVTNGIISSTKREILVNGVTMSLMQTNAAVSPGNSGGGIFNMRGQLIGIVNAKSSGSGIEGLGFAIPVNDALGTVEQLMEYGYVRGKVFIGVTFREITRDNTFYYYYSVKEGTYVSELTKGYNDGVLAVGDRVVAVNGTTITAYSDIKAIVMQASVGDTLEFQVERNGKLIQAVVTCYEKTPDGISKIQFDNNSQTD